MFNLGSKTIISGLAAAILLLAIYFGALSIISGWDYTFGQFTRFWYFIVVLALGFGTQIGMFVYLREKTREKVSAKIVATTGTTSTAAMISCCAHYLANILPILGVSGIAAFIGQYQTELFGVGILFNLLGIIYMTSKIVKFKQHEKHC